MLLPYMNKELIKISDKKEIYVVYDEPILVKVGDHKLINEFHLQSEACKITNCPKVMSLIEADDKIYFLMEKIEGKTIYELYGDNPKNVPDDIFKQIQKIISQLYYQDIHYVDISPYNFIVSSNKKVYIIDFGDAYKSKVNWFLKDFLDGEKSWNPDFY